MADDNKKAINVKIDADLHTYMKMRCVEQKLTLGEYLESVIVKDLNLEKDKNGKWTRNEK